MDTTRRMDETAEYHLDVEYSRISGLNFLDVVIPKRQPASDVATWVIYIHGGAWRDPLITRTSFNPAYKLLLESSSSICGLASLDYRLSPYPDHPTNPSTPGDPSRNAKHPDHLNDFITALKYLQQHYIRGGRYILCGHSCGATLVMQALEWLTRNPQIPPPIGVLGSEGIYDIPNLLKRNTHPAYREFIIAAFGDDEQLWQSASPTHLSFNHEDMPKWQGHVVLSHSEEDELVEQEQVTEMKAALVAQGWNEVTAPARGQANSRSLMIIDARGRHDQVWEEGKELARAIKLTLEFALGQTS